MAVKLPSAGAKPADTSNADVGMLTGVVRVVSGNAETNPKKKMEVPKTVDSCSKLGVKCK